MTDGVPAPVVTLEEVRDGVATILIDRPPVNALGEQVHRELRHVVDAVAARASVRAVVLYGGDKVFAAGADISEMVRMDREGIAARINIWQAGYAALAELEKPVIAAVVGYALGGGLELALCADMRVCGSNSRLGVPEILLGVIPGLGGTQRLTRLIGLGQAKRLVYFGQFVGAEEALRIGLVDEVVPDAEVYDRTLTLARQLAEGPPLALAAAKRCLDQAMELPLPNGLELEQDEFAALFDTEDQREGMSSFMEKGPGKARFTGR